MQRDYALSGAVCEQSGNLLPQKNPRRNGRSAIQTLQLWGSATHFEYETVSVDDSTVCLLEIVSEFVSRLIQLDVIRAGHDHHDDPAVLVLLDRTPELRSFCT